MGGADRMGVVGFRDLRIGVSEPPGDHVDVRSVVLTPKSRRYGEACALCQFQQRVTLETAQALRYLKFKGEKNGHKFWFYTGNCERDTAITNWRERVGMRTQSSVFCIDMILIAEPGPDSLGTNWV
jgi:hypothetical protein